MATKKKAAPKSSGERINDIEAKKKALQVTMAHLERTSAPEP